MQIAGNFLLFLCVLAAGLLFKVTFLQKMPGGDAGVGYAYGLLYLISFFWICITLVACIIGFGGGFAWLSLGRFGSGGMLALCFILMVAGANLGMEGSFRSTRYLGVVNAVATPLVMMAAFAVLLNQGLKVMIPANIVKWGLASIFATNSLILASMLLAPVTSVLRPLLPRDRNKLSDFDQGILERIDKWDTNKDITGLFIYSGNNQPRKIQELAVLKIKSKPGWQDDLLKTLENDGVEDAFRFLLSNEVDDKPKFAKGVYQGVLSMARWIRENMRSCWHQSHFYNGKYGTEIRRTLEAVEKFKGLGVDFKPAVQELRAALDEPISYDFPDPSDKKLLDKWLKKH